MQIFKYRSLAALPLCALLAAPLPAQQQAPAQQEPQSLFGEQIEVRVVNVEAVVTDRQGNRVPDLKPSDFRLTVDGKPVAIEYFTEVRGGAAIAPTGNEAAAPVQGLPALAPGSPVGTSYLVYIDNVFSIGARRNEVLKSLKADLARLGPEDRMAIVAYDGRLQMLSSWSNSEQDLSRALDQAMGMRSYGASRLSELRAFETSRTLTGEVPLRNRRGSFAERMEVDELGFVQHVASLVERTVSGAVSTLRGFAAPPGRKVMLVLSGGWPYSPADYVLNNPSRPVLSSRDIPRGEEIFHPLVDTANRLGYTLYPVDVPGVEAVSASALTVGPPAGGINIREQEVEASLRHVAKQTGGRALLNSTRGNALENVEGDTRSYYWLGFTPTWKGNDQRHDVRVEVLRPGLEVRNRDSFLDLSRKAEVSMMVESAMLFGNPPGAVSMPIQLGKPVPSGKKLMVVPITLAIPVESITLVPVEGRYASELELRVAAVDEDGNRSDVPVIPLTVSSEKQPEPGGYVKYETRLTLRRKGHHLTVAIFDPLSGRITTAEADVEAAQR
jgi:VWFA-related protein